MDTIFKVLLFVGLGIGLLCVLICIHLVFAKKVKQCKTEIELAKWKLKTTHTGIVLAFLGIYLFTFSGFAYSRMKTNKELQSQKDTLMTTTARDLRREFHEAINGRKLPISPDAFSRVNLLIAFLEQIEPQNGYSLYYSGEVKRYEGLCDEAQQYFFKYLEKQDTLPEEEKGGDIGSEICYERQSGFCRQRSGWIRHLLANDFYLRGVSAKTPALKLYLFRKALEQAIAAKRDFPPNGFVQLQSLCPCQIQSSTCEPLPTAVLESKLNEEIEELERLSPEASLIAPPKIGNQGDWLSLGFGNEAVRY